VKIPSDALIPEDKLTRYLLVPRAKNDKSRFLAQAGFTLNNPRDLERAIRRITSSTDAIWIRHDEYGDFYSVDGDLIGPTGRAAVTTIWIIQTHLENRFRFVTLKPRRKTDDEA
jgi:hypothetical protein